MSTMLDSGQVITGLVTIIVALCGGGAGATVVVKRMNRRVDDANAGKIRAEARETAQRTASSEVDTLREIIAEVRTAAREEKARDSARIDDLVARVEKLEERERHALTRAAVHEAWDQLALAFVLKHDSNFPSPPPLADRSIEPGPPATHP